jgi:hypothetical protein
MSLSDVRRRKTEAPYFHHSIPLSLTEAASGGSNRMLDLTIQSQAAMSATQYTRVLAMGLPAPAKIICAEWATESAEFQAINAERQKANHIHRFGESPKNRMQLSIKADGKQTDKRKAPQERYKSEFSQASVL